MTQFLWGIDEPIAYRELKGVVERRNCLLFAGPILAVHAYSQDGRRPPSWFHLFPQIINWCYQEAILGKQDADEISIAISRGYFSDGSKELEKAFLDKDMMRRCLSDILLCGKAGIGRAHLLTARIPFRAYLTNNYDTFIDDAYRSTHNEDLKTFYEPSTLMLRRYYENKPFILKMYGDVKDPESLVLGDRAYSGVVYDGRKNQRNFTSLLSNSSVLFLGFEDGDVELRGVLDSVPQSPARNNRHWLVIPRGALPTLTTKRLWSEKSIATILYDSDHDEGIVSFLERLADSLIPSRPPHSSRYGSTVSTTKIVLGSSNPPYLELEIAQTKGGSMSTEVQKHKSVKVFISYAHEDSKLRMRLDKHLANLKNLGVIDTWYDGDIVAGQEWEPAILEQLNAADVILLLISADFMASRYIHTKELARAMERHEANEACVIPVLLQPVEYRGAPFDKLESLPLDAQKRPRAITTWSSRDTAFAKVASGIRVAIEVLNTTKSSSNP